MKVNLYSIDGEIKSKIDLPEIFNAPCRPDLIKRAVVAMQANRRQPYGASRDFRAGMGHSAEWWGKGRGVSRVPRIKNSIRGAQSPGCVGGRRAHPPRAERDWSKKINKKERKKAFASAIAATADKKLVEARGHMFDTTYTLPIVLENKLEDISTSKELVKLLVALNVYEDIMRVKNNIKIRAGKGKMRNRRYRIRKSILFVANDTSKLYKSARNLLGIDVCTSKNLNTELLAPGGIPGRLTIFSENALAYFKNIRGEK
jgi:large subunit ribosomal protein L4e